MRTIFRLTFLFVFAVAMQAAGIDRAAAQAAPIALLDSLAGDSHQPYVAVLLITPGDCIKCVALADEAVASVNTMPASAEKVTLVAAVSVARERELKSFIRNYSWAHRAIVDHGDIRTSLHLAVDDGLAVYERKTGICLGVIKHDEFDGDLSPKLRKLLHSKTAH